jgi:hypothetical protein
MIFYIRFFLVVLACTSYSFVSVGFSQEVKKDRFISIGESIFERGIFQFTTDNKYRYDVILVSTKPADKNKVDISDFAERIKILMKKILIDSLIPDNEFIEKNKICYSVPVNPKKKLPFPWRDGHDIVYLSYSVDDLTILLAFIGSNSYGNTYLFISKSSQGKTEKIDEKILSKILNKDAIKMIRFIGDNNDDIKLYGRNADMKSFPQRVIPVYRNQQSVCLVVSHFFENDIVSTDYDLNQWFMLHKKWKKISEERVQGDNVVKKLVVDRQEQCKTLIKTPQGRAKLIELAVSDEFEPVFKNSVIFSYRDFQGLPKRAIMDYYRDMAMSDEVNFSKIPSFGFNKEIPISPEEVEAIRRLLKSDDLVKRYWGVYLLRRTACRSLVSDLLNICVDKRYEKAKNSCDTFVKGRLVIIEYNYVIIMSIAELGDERTLRSLRPMLKSNDTPDDFKPDIKQAIDHIENNMIELKRQKQKWLNKRREVREGQLIVMGGIIDIDKPDPEPISPEGFRKWETSDGLFKTTAKFVGLKEIKDKTGKIIDKDVQLLRNDNKTVAIELSALRLIDREYIRQQFEPEREWISTDKNVELKLKAKLLGKFDKEIIVQESDGINTTLKIESLSESDKEYLKQIPISPHSKYVF